MFTVGGKNISDYIFGWGTTPDVDGYYAEVVSSYFKIKDTPVRAVRKNSKFMPFSNQPPISGFSYGGSQLLTADKYAGVLRFVRSTTVGHSSSTRDGSEVSIYYKGGGSYNSYGTLKVGSTEIRNCPPVILIYVQAAGGNGGGSRKDGIWLGQTFTGGGGGGSGAFWAFYMELPYNTGGSFTKVLSYKMDSNVNFYRDDGVLFATVGAGDNGQTPDDGEFGHRAGGAGGRFSSYALPNNIKSCCFYDRSGSLASPRYLEGVSGGNGGTGSALFGGIVGSSDSTSGGPAPTYTRFFIDQLGDKIPPSRTFSSGSGSSKGGGAGGGGGGSRMGSGGKGADGGDGFGGGSSGGSANGYGAGGGGGSTGGSGFAVNYNGGKGSDPYIAFVW